jgi:hypothetical protein
MKVHQEVGPCDCREQLKRCCTTAVFSAMQGSTVFLSQQS